jgi:predicted DNA-binding ribbon-helix-helix protein
MQSTVEKRSVTIRCHKTSVSLEGPFWKALREIARRRNVNLSELVEIIDQNRKQGNLSSTIRLFVLGVYQDQIAPPQPEPKGSGLALVVG